MSETAAECQHEMTAEYVKVRLNDGYFCEKCGALMVFVPEAKAKAASALLRALRHGVGILDRPDCSCCPGGAHDTPTGFLSESRAAIAQAESAGVTEARREEQVTARATAAHLRLPSEDSVK